MTETPWGTLGYLVYKRTYARTVSKNKTEEFKDTINRIITACNTQLKCNFTDAQQQELQQYMLQLKCSVAGRFLWQLGTDTVKRLGLASLQNCACVTVNDLIRPFVWAFDMLMLGCGVGYNIQAEYVYEIPKVKRAKIVRLDTKDADFIVPDSREGWVKLLELVLKAHQTGEGFSYSTICIRNKGVPIKGFGGVASGAESLCQGIGQINDLLNTRANKKLRPIDALDIMNIIGSIVVSGNVRRSSQISIGDYDDIQFLNAKRWDKYTIPNWRVMSNNSVVCNDINGLPEAFWETYGGNGEPYGLINLALAQRTGRIGDGRCDPDIIGFNPCAEQPLGNYETCCLAEVFLPNISTESEFRNIIRYLYTIAKRSLELDCHHKETDAIVNRHMRMGIGLTGILQASELQRSWLSDGYRFLRNYDKEYSAKHGLPESIRLTTVKPSGTLSLLAGVTAGIHPAYSQYYIRRVRMQSNSSLVEVCKQHGYPVEYEKRLDGSLNYETSVVSFYVAHPQGTVTAENLSAIEQLEWVRWVQTNWSDNAVSCTIYYRQEELPDIKQYLYAYYNNNFKSLSFLPKYDHGFEQAPMEEITKEQYETLVANTRPIVSVEVSDSLDFSECDNGQCPIK